MKRSVEKIKKSREKLFIVLFSISFFLNLRQCSDIKNSESYVEELEYELMESESEITNINQKNIKKTKVNKLKIEVKEVKKIKPITKSSLPVDSIQVEISDSTFAN